VSYYHDDPTQEVTYSRSFLPGLLVLIVLITGGGIFVKSTLAANINLSSGSAIEFGQSVSQAVACSGSENITVTPRSSFVNAANGSGTYYLSSITVGNIPTSCYGDDFTINAYNNSSSTPLALFNSTSTSPVVHNNNGVFELGVGTLIGASISSGSGTYTITFTNAVALSSSVFKLTIQSSVHTLLCSEGGECAVGDIGPGGGAVFYKANSSFSCGPTRSSLCEYLEAAPSGWNGGSEPGRTWAQNTPVSYQSTTVNNAGSPQTATATEIGWGYRNTRAIILQGNTNTSTSAAALADSYTVTVRGVAIDDWYLPSRDELNQMCKWQGGVAWTSDATVCTGVTLNSGTGAAGFTDAWFYWSSSENTGSGAHIQRFSDGAQATQGGKNGAYYVRPIRAF